MKRAEANVLLCRKRCYEHNGKQCLTDLRPLCMLFMDRGDGRDATNIGILCCTGRA